MAQIIDPIRGCFLTAYIVHYMDDLLIATKDLPQTYEIAQIVVASLQKRGFVIAPEKNRGSISFHVLGLPIRTHKTHKKWPFKHLI